MALFLTSLIVTIIDLFLFILDRYSLGWLSKTVFSWLKQPENPPPRFEFIFFGVMNIFLFLILYHLVIKKEANKSKEYEDHFLNPFFNFVKQILGNKKEAWPVFLLLPSSIIVFLVIYLVYKGQIESFTWWVITITLFGLWSNFLWGEEQEFDISKEQRSEIILQTDIVQETEESQSVLEIIKAQHWYHNQVTFRIPWPTEFHPTSNASWVRINERFQTANAVFGSDSFHENVIRKDPILNSISSSFLTNGIDTEHPKFFKHQEEVFKTLLDKVDEHGNPIHVLMSTPVGSGRTTVALSMALKTIYTEDKNILVVYDDPIRGRYLTKQFNNALRSSRWGWSISVAEYWSDVKKPEWSQTSENIDYPITNPDVLIVDIETLHSIMLPEHKKWEHFLSALDLILIEGLEKYNGIFGANAAFVINRLLRIAKHYQAAPQIFATTIASKGLEPFFEKFFNLNPLEFKSRQIVEINGRSKKSKELLVWNTAIAHQNIISSINSPRLEQEALHEDIQNILATLIAHGRKPVLIHKGVEVCGAEIKNISKKVLEIFDENLRKDVAVLIGEGIEILMIEEGEVKVASPMDFDTAVVTGLPGSWEKLMHELEHLGENTNVDRPSVIVVLPYTPMFQYLGKKCAESFGEINQVIPLLPIRNPILQEIQLKAALSELPSTNDEIGSWFGDAGYEALDRLIKNHEIKSEEIYELNPRNEDLFTQVKKYSLVNSQYRVKSNVRGVGEKSWFLIEDGKTRGELSEDFIGWRAYKGALFVAFGQRFEIKNIDRENRRINVITTRNPYPVSTERILEFNDGDIILEPDEDYGHSIKSVRYREGAKELLVHAPMWATIKEKIIGYSLYKSYTYFNAGGSYRYQPPEEREVFQTRAFVCGFPEATPEIIHTISHLIRSVLPLYLSKESLAMEVVELESCDFLGQSPAIVIYDAIPGGTGVADWLQEETNLEDILRKAADLLISCSCKDGCRGCLIIHDCHTQDPDVIGECRKINKLETMKYLGEVLFEHLEDVIQSRTDKIENQRDIEYLRDFLVEFIFPHKFGMEIHNVADIIITPNIPEDILGYYINTNKVHEVRIKPLPERELLLVLAHLYAHNWEYQGKNGLHPSLSSSSKDTLDGFLIQEGFAHWIEYKVADYYGFHGVMKNFEFQINKEFPEGFNLLYWIEYGLKKTRGIGAQKVLEFIQTGKIYIDDEEMGLETLINKSGIRSKIRESQYEKTFNNDVITNDKDFHQIFIASKPQNSTEESEEINHETSIIDTGETLEKSDDSDGNE